jgi:putative membrane protein
MTQISDDPSQSGRDQDGASQHGASQPGRGQSGASQQGTSRHGRGQHVTSQHVTSQHVTSQRGRGQHGASQDADGTEPDVRFTLANERTFLAWSRTSLALVVAGLAIAQLLPPFAGLPWGRSVIATPLILLGAVVSVFSYREWTRNEHALRHGDPLNRSRLPRVLALTIALIALLAAALDLYSRLAKR